MKYVAFILVLGLVGLAIYPNFVEEEKEADRSAREEGGKELVVDREIPGKTDAIGSGAQQPVKDDGAVRSEPTKVDTIDPDAAGAGKPEVAKTEGDPTIPAPGAGTQEPTKKINRPNVIKDDIVADVVYGVLRDLVLGNATSNDRAILETRLEEMLEVEKMGSKELREQAVVVTVSTMLRQTSQYKAVDGGLTDFQRLAMKALSNEFARDLYRRLPVEGQGGGHSGTLKPAVEVAMPEGYIRAKWAVLGGFEYEEGMELPKAVTDLNGKKIGIAGYMMTLEEVEDIHEFLLVESLWSCCFGTPPEVHQVVVVTMDEGVDGVDYTTAPILILGDMSVGEEVEDGFVTSVYRVKASSVKEVQ